MNGFKILNRSTEHRLALLRKNATLGDASIDTLQQLAEIAVPLRLRKGATLWQEGAPATSIACVVHGALLVQQVDMLGRIVYYDLKTSGDLIGHVALAADTRHAATPRAPLMHHATIAAREESVVLVITGAVFQAAIERDPRLVRRLLRNLSESIHMLMSEIFTERVYQGKYLLAAKLVSLAAMDGVHEGGVYLPYSQLDLSRFTGLGTRNISTFIAELPATRTTPGRKGVQIESIEVLRAFLRTAQQKE